MTNGMLMLEPRFHKPDKKINLLIESGVRMHTTEYQREKADTPSNFNIKLRKHVKTKRLISLKQINGDRKVDFQFGENEYAFHVEFFASGNIILTDHEYRIMSLMRVVEVAEETPIAVGQIYELKRKQDDPPLTTEFLRSIFESALVDEDTAPVPDQLTDQSLKQKKKKSKKKVSSLRNVLRSALGLRYGPALVDHAIALSQIPPDWSDFHGINDDIFDSLLKGFRASDDILKVAIPQKGYIMATGCQSEYVFDEFHPFKPAYINQNNTNINQTAVLEFDSFDRAVDEFYSKIESQKFEQKAKQAEAHAIKKLESVKENSATQIRNFHISQQEKEMIALAIELNLEIVDQAIKTICSFVASGMDWGDLGNLVKEEQEKGNPLARIITRLKLEVGMISLSLPHPDWSMNDNQSDGSDFSGDSTDEEIEKAETPLAPSQAKPSQIVVVDVNIYESAYSNARSYYGAKKVAIEKGKKTLEASVRQLEIAEKKILASLEKKEANVPTITRYRPPYWFEKFLWFISSENYLVVGGRDATQSELLVTKHLEPGDFYLNADIEKSYSVIVKKIDDDAPSMIPPTTLLQAGTMAICQSKAWESKILTSAFWVPHNQVTKLSLAGDDLPTGVFQIKGKKNYLPPIQLIYGIGLLFQVGQESIENHLLERKLWARNGGTVDEKGQASIDRGYFERAEDNIEEQEVNQAATDIMYSAKSTHPPRQRGVDEKDVDGHSEISVVEEKHVYKQEEEEEKVQDDEEQGEEQNEEKTVKSKFSTNLVPIKTKRGDVDTEDQSVTSSVQSSPSVPFKKANQARGKKGKLKKMNVKYADQDEEDRALALKVLGSDKGPQPKGKKAKAMAEKQRLHEERSRIEKEKQEAKKLQEKKLDKKGSSSKSLPNPISISTEDFTVPRVNLDHWTGIPLEKDELIHCIPVCAPWSVLQKYKYKAKLLPGSQKRGKAAKSAEALFISQATKSKKNGGNDRIDLEIDLIRQVVESDWINAMLSKVKVVG